MNEASPNKRSLLILFGTGFLVRVALALAPVRWLMLKVFPDDSFMYWQVARNILAGNGASLDGVNLTTAYHPLWMLPTLGIMALFDNGGDLPVHLSLLLSGTLDVVTGYLVWKAARLLTKDKRLAFWAAAAFLFNPYEIGYALSGLGDGLNSLCLLAHFYLYLKLWEDRCDKAVCWALLGTLAGLAMLARTDSVFFHIAVLLHLLLAWESDSLWDRLRRPLIVGLASCLLVVPWLLYMHHVTGHFMQTSASAHPWVNHMRHAAKPLWWKALYSAGKTAVAFFWNMPVAAAWGPVLAALGLWILGKRAGPDSAAEENLRRRRRLLALPFYAMAALCIVHGGIRWFIRQWYFFPMAWLVPLWGALLWQTYGEKLGSGARRALATVLVVGVAGTIFRIWIFGNYPWQADMYDLAHQLGKAVEKKERPSVGGFNILAQAYYNPNQVMNLDGIGNDAVLKDIQAGRLGDYIDRVGLEYIIDWDYYLRKRHADHLPENFGERLEPVIRCGSPGSLWKWKGPLTLYRILPQGKKADSNAHTIPCERQGAEPGLPFAAVP